MKKNKSKMILGFFVFIVAILAFLYFTGSIRFALPTGAKPIGSPIVTTASTYTCDEEYCVGYCSFSCDKIVGNPSIVMYKPVTSLTESGAIVYFNKDKDQTLERYRRTGLYGGSLKLDYAVKRSDGTYLLTPEGYFMQKVWVSIDNDFTRLYIWRTSTDAYVFTMSEPLETLAATPTQSCTGNEVCDSGNTYACTYGAEVNSDPQWGDSSGVSYKTKTETRFNAWTGQTSEKDMAINDVMTCNPKDGVGVNLADDKSTITVQKYTTVCSNECKLGDTYCSPQPATSYYCSSYKGGSETRCAQNCKGTCSSGVYQSSSSTTTRDAITNVLCNYQYASTCSYNNPATYKKCEANKVQPKPGIYCNDWGTTIYTCPTAQACKLKDSGQTGVVGVGACGCASSDCNGYNVGYKKSVDGVNNQYYECTTINNCPAWSTTKTCNTGLVFSENSQDCVCDNKCSNYERKCVDDTHISICDLAAISGKQCWVLNTETANGDLATYPRTCKSDGTNAWFECTNQPCLGVNQKRCNLNTLFNCVQDVESGCLYLKAEATKTRCCIADEDCDAGYECRNNNCETVEGYCNLNSDCVSGKECFNNMCQWPTTGQFCTQAEASAGETACINNNAHICKSQSDGSYKWTLLDTCDNQEICVKQSPAQCVPLYQYVGIICPNTNCLFGLNENIGGIKVDVTAAVGVNSNIRVAAVLKESATTIKIVNTVTNSDGDAMIDFAYVSPKSGTLTMEVYVGNECATSITDPKCYKTTKNILVQKRLDVKLNCPLQAYMNQEAICEFKTLDQETGQLVSGVTPKISVLQGGLPIAYNTVSDTKFNFKSTVVGSVNVKVEVSKTDFILDSEELLVSVIQPTQDFAFLIDSKDFFTYGTSGIDTGTKQLTLTLKEGSTPIDATIDAKIRTPTGQEQQLAFVKTEPGIYKATYSFQEAGDTYVFKGTITPLDISKSSVPFEYKIATLAAGTTKTSGYIWIIVGGIVGVLAFIVILSLALKKRK